MTTSVILNNSLNGIEISFDTIPSEEIRTALKEVGYRWHKVKKLWYAKQNDDTMKVADALATTKLESVSAPKAKPKTFDFDIKVGDLFECSWGYEQTNVNFFQVIELVGTKSIRVREVAPEIIKEDAVSGMSADRTYKNNGEILPPIRSIFIDDNKKGVLKRVKSFASDGKANPCFEIGRGGYLCYKYSGGAVYESWYY